MSMAAVRLLLQAKLGHAKHWVLANVGDTCDDACAARGKSCDPETTIGDISDAEFDQLVKDNHLTMDERFSLFPNDIGPYTPIVQITHGAVKRRCQVRQPDHKKTCSAKPLSSGHHPDELSYRCPIAECALVGRNAN